ncbi:uncharacterized protein E0L32_006550 [Thyridium curvatum]|uniref:Transcription factor CBF/NF-Y/archaeal histone domain-containing protein n=1 Tax=Thyridium curvatum TaxID=1093900 RepID=A0A507B317_9PEZI|nr:uncharacterized protein E0L32_006550 [Thyridium curvatum]TPX13124.1 hypothetical protein E0L32_006550 [Thyridium curvatum]
MPYNTTAIPPRKEVTGTTQLPFAVSRVKKIVAVDPDVNMCSNNAAFVITLAAELFIQHLATEAQNMAKLERKPRRNIQYKDLAWLLTPRDTANAVQHADNLEFLEDVIPKTASYRQVKDQVAATQARLRGDKPAEGSQQANGASKKQQAKSAAPLVNGGGNLNGFAQSASSRSMLMEEDPSAQLELEMRQAHGQHDGDVEMMG